MSETNAPRDAFDLSRKAQDALLDLIFHSEDLQGIAERAKLLDIPEKLPWPIGGRMIVNGYSYLDTRPPEWFEGRPVWVTDFADFMPTNETVLRNAAGNLARRPNWVVGPAPISALTIQNAASMAFVPANSVLTENVPVDIPLATSQPFGKNRKAIDVTSKRARLIMANRISEHTSGHKVAFVDNAAAHSSTGGDIPWETQCQYLSLIAWHGHQNGTRLVFNIATHMFAMSQEEVDMLANAVSGHGICLEEPLHINVTSRQEETAASYYHQLKTRDVGLVLLELNPKRGPGMRSFVDSWARKEDPVWLVYSFLYPTPDWLFPKEG